MDYVKAFRELGVYKLARRLFFEIFYITRRYEKHFINKLTDADGKQLETPHWIVIIYRKKSFLFLQGYAKIGRILINHDR